MKVAILGIGNVRCAPAIIASLSGYFGERPLEIHLWDSDEERLELFDRFARLCFNMTKSKHSLLASEVSEEAIDGSAGLLLAVGVNCARKFLKNRGSLLGHGETDSVLVQRCVSELIGGASLDANILSLIDVEPDGHPWTQETWPPEPSDEARTVVPHQILRYLNGEEYAHDLLKRNASSPVTEWLDRISR
jgi:hypothetical protein